MTVSRSTWRIGGQAGSLFAARLVAAVFGIGVHLLLARLLGPEQLGLFFLATSLATVGAVIAAGGYPSIVLKTLAAGHSSAQRGEALAGVGSRDALLAAGIIVGLMLAGATLMPNGSVIVVAALALPLVAWGRLISAFSVARGDPFVANLPELLVRPILMAAGLGVLVAAGARIDASDAAWLFVASAAAALGVLTVCMARRGTLPQISASVSRRYRSRLRRMSFPLAPVSVLSAFFGDAAIITAGMFLSSAELGVFAVALKISLLIGFAVQALHQIELPRIAAAYARSSAAEARTIVVHLNRITVLATAIGATATAGLAPYLLAWFGAAFVAGSSALAILAVVQVARAYCGPAVQVLTLLSAQRTSSVLSLAAGLVLLAGCAALAPGQGALGAAVATGTAMLAWFGSASYFAARYGLSTAGIATSQASAAPWRMLTIGD